MLNVIIIMSVGLAIGALLKSHKKLLAHADRVVTYAIWLLLFLLGLSIGTNEAVVRNIGSLGIEAAVVTIFTISFSVLLAYVLFRFVFYHEK